VAQRTRPRLFFALAIGFSWLCWIPAGLLGREAAGLAITVLHYLGGAGPLLAALVLVYGTLDRAGRRDYWQRALQFTRIGPWWYAVIFLSVPALTGLAALLDILAGGRGGWAAEAARLTAAPWAGVSFVLFSLIFGPIPEELGWRGYALDGLQSRWSALTSSLIVGMAWTLWHLPLFAIEGTYQHGLGLGTVPFWLYMLDKVPESVLMTWIYNHNRRSSLSAILFHFAINATGELFDLTLRAEICYIGLLIAAAIAVTLIWGPRTLTRARRQNGPR
jgi:membrane protease YdiL (CAAX protease family)